MGANRAPRNVGFGFVDTVSGFCLHRADEAGAAFRSALRRRFLHDSGESPRSLPLTRGRLRSLVSGTAADSQAGRPAGARDRDNWERDRAWSDQLSGGRFARSWALIFSENGSVLRERHVRLDACYVGLIDDCGFGHQAFAFRALGREQMATRGVLTQDFSGGGDFKSFRYRFPCFGARDWLRHRARKIDGFPEVTTAFRSPADGGRRRCRHNKGLASRA